MIADFDIDWDRTKAGEKSLHTTVPVTVLLELYHLQA